MFGTPEPNAHNRGRTPHRQERQTDDSKEHAGKDEKKTLLAPNKTNNESSEQANASPTKGILATPGTTTNKRKTVSFGDGVVDNEHKRDEATAKLLKTPPPNLSAGLRTQRTSDSSDGKDKPRSRLTQTLLEARENQTDHGHLSELDRSKATTQKADAMNDDTVNLDEPHSQSGMYWKTEFENYRINTNREIRKLIQYRRAAKSYAKKKDDEASRLLAKIREEESKVTEMERRVSHLAGTMVSEGSKGDREKLVQELTKQTALALQYKHQVNQLRKTLEQHKLLGDEEDTIGLRIDEKGVPKKPEKEALNQTETKNEGKKLQQSDSEKLQDLVQSSEKKASTLEKENDALKQTISRYRQEMTKYEDRRKEREAKLKQREDKLETRVLDFRERLRKSSQQRRESEEALKTSFDEERRHLQGQIDLLKTRLSANVEEDPDIPRHGHYSYSPRKIHYDTDIHDFGLPDQDEYDSEDDDDNGPPSPSPRSKERLSRESRARLADELGIGKYIREAAHEENEDGDDDTGLTLSEYSPVKPSRYNPRPKESGAVPPSSPPILPSIETSARPLAMNSKRHSDNHSHRPQQPVPSTVTGTTQSYSSRRPQQSHTSRTLAKPSYGSVSIPTRGASNHHQRAETSARQGYATFPTRSNKKATKLEDLPPERLEAALASLRRKAENKRARQLQGTGLGNDDSSVRIRGVY